MKIQLREDIVAGALLLLVAYFECHGAFNVPGILSYVDFNVPLTMHATVVSIERYLAGWDWYSNAGRPNPSFLAEDLLLYVYFVFIAIAGAALGSKMLLLFFVFLTALGAYGALRYGGCRPSSSAIGAAFFIGNPWFYDEISQGHVYLLMTAAALPFLFSAFVTQRRWKLPVYALASLALFAVIVIDFRFAAIAYGVAAVALLLVIAKIGRAELFKRVAAMACGAILSAGTMLPSAMMFHALASGNTPPSNSLSYYSSFLSPLASITLVRYNYNTSEALGALGGFSLIWWIVIYLTVLIAIRTLLRERTAAGLAAGIIWVAGALLALGDNPPLGAVNVLLYQHVPLMADLFRDPSKFFVLNTTAMSFALAWSADRFHHSWPSTAQRVSNGTSLADLMAIARAYVGSVNIGNLRHAGLMLLIAVEALPFCIVAPGPMAGLDPSVYPAAFNAVREAAKDAGNARMALYPIGVRTDYAESVVIYDPAVIFPTVPDVRVPVAYDFDASSLAARWALGASTSGYQSDALGALDDIGVGAIGIRPGVSGSFDLPSEVASFTGPSADANARAAFTPGSPNDVAVIPNASIAVTADHVASVDDGDRGVVAAARELDELPAASIWCDAASCGTVSAHARFELAGAPDPSCPLGTDRWKRDDGRLAASWQQWAGFSTAPVRFGTPPIVLANGAIHALLPACARGVHHVWILAQSGANDTLPPAMMLDSGTRSVALRSQSELGSTLQWIDAGPVPLSQSLTIRNTGQTPVLIEDVRIADTAAQATVEVASPLQARRFAGSVAAHGAAGAYGGSEALFRAGSSAELSALPRGRWMLHVSVRKAHAATLVAASSSTCTFTLRENGVSTCSIESSGTLRLSVTSGEAGIDLISLSSPSSLSAAAFAGHAVRFRHGLNDYAVSAPPRALVAVKVGDPRLWDGTPTAGTAYGYAPIFTVPADGRIDETFSPTRMQGLIVAISLVIAVLLSLLVAYTQRYEQRA
jgi:hypothetical protein